MAEGDLSVTTGGAHTPLRELFLQLDANSIPNRELYSETLHCLNNLAQYRRMRIFAGNDTVPPVIWLVLLVGGVFAVCIRFLWDEKHTGPVPDYHYSHGVDLVDFVFGVRA